MRPIPVHFSSDYNSRAKKGTKTYIDKIEPDRAFRSGVKCRVSCIWKRPRYFNPTWFKEEKRLIHIGLKMPS